MFVTTPTRAEFRATLSNRLNDSQNVHWTIAELNLLIAEAVRTWNSGAFYHRARGIVQTTIGEPFYDLPSLLDDGSGNKILSMTASAQDACTAIEYSLMETPTPDFTSAWSGTEQLSFADISSAIERRRNQFLVETGQIITVADLVPVTSGNGRIALEDTFIDVRRVAWKSIDGIFTNLWKVDEVTLNRRLVGWNRNANTPQSYSIVVTPETSVQLGPVPIDSGNLHILAAESPAAIDLTDSASLVGVFEDFVPAVLWGARAEILSRDGPSKDEQRAAYGEQRFREGVELAKIMASTLQVLVDDEDVPVQSLERLDLARPNWQHTSAAVGVSGVEIVAQAGPNLIALYKVPSIKFNFTVDVVRNAIVPALDSDRIQIGDEFLGSLLGYCVHLAMFKEGGAEFMATMPLYKNFFMAAAGFNRELRANSRNFPVLYEKAQVDRKEREAEQAA